MERLYGSVNIIICGCNVVATVIMNSANEPNFDIVFNSVDFGVIQPRHRMQFVSRI